MIKNIMRYANWDDLHNRYNQQILEIKAHLKALKERVIKEDRPTLNVDHKLKPTLLEFLTEGGMKNSDGKKYE